MTDRLLNSSSTGIKRRKRNYLVLIHTLIFTITVLSVGLGLHSPSIAKNNRFYCEIEVNNKGKSIPTTIVRAKRGNEIRIIYWLSKYFSKSGGTPKRRCKNTSQQLQKYYDNGWLKFIRTDVVDNVEVICVARTKGGKCNKTDTIVTLPPNINRFKALASLLDLRRIASGRPLYLTNKLITYKNGEVYVHVKTLLNINTSSTP